MTDRGLNRKTATHEGGLDDAHFTHKGYRQLMTTRELVAMIDERGGSPKAVHKGTVVPIKWKRVVPGRYEVWLETVT